jgi:hypothetical protein
LAENSEHQFQGELIQPGRVVRGEGGDRSEGWISELRVAAAQRNDVARRIADVVGLSAELDVGALGYRKGLGDGQIDVAEVGPEERISGRGSDGASGLGRKGGGVEELVQGPVTAWIGDLIGAISAAVVVGTARLPNASVTVAPVVGST